LSRSLYHNTLSRFQQIGSFGWNSAHYTTEIKLETFDISTFFQRPASEEAGILSTS